MDDADRWWHSLTDARREQIHRMMSPEARQEAVPQDQMVLPGPTKEEIRVA